MRSLWKLLLDNKENKGTKKLGDKGMSYKSELCERASFVSIYRTGCSHFLEVITNLSIHLPSPYLSISSIGLAL